MAYEELERHRSLVNTWSVIVENMIRYIELMAQLKNLSVADFIDLLSELSLVMMSSNSTEQHAPN